MLSTMRSAIPRASSLQARYLSTKVDATPPLTWRLAHGMFDFETSMTEKYPGIPDPSEVAPAQPSSVTVTTLDNGVRVCSQDLGQPVSSLGIYIGAGSRDETPITAGSSHLLERLAFKGSSARSKYRMVRDMERSGALYNAAASRETISFSAEGLRGHTAEMVDILTEAALAPAAASTDTESPDWNEAVSEIATGVKTIKKQLEAFESDAASRVTEAVHAAAFSGNSLGLPLVAEARKLDALAPNTLAEFIGQNFGSDNIVVSGTNIEHSELVNMANNNAMLTSLTPRNLIRDAKYTGGNVSMSADGPAHVAIGFRGVSWKSKELVPSCVLYTLLGGGGSFSSGGPGKGMYTRLYREVLNRHAWISSAMAFNHCYADTGIFGIHASCDDPAHMNNLVEVVAGQLGKLSGAVTKEELERAKNMTKSSLIMNLESRNVVCEDMGRQILAADKYIAKEQLAKAIDAVTIDDLRKIAHTMLISKPAIVKYGEDYASYDVNMIEGAIKSQAKIAA